jgi:hypothetical protein
VHFDARVDGRLKSRHAYALELIEDETRWWRRVLVYLVGFCVGPLRAKGVAR